MAVPTTDHRQPATAVRCPHFLQGCGGCTWQHIPYPEQLTLKTALVERLVRAAVPAAPVVRPMLPATAVDDPWGYRHKVHFVFGRTPRGPVIGHYLSGSRRVLPVRECPVHDPRGNDVAFAFARALATTRLTTVRGIAVRVGANTAEVMATLVVSEPPDKRLRAISRRVLDGRHAPTAFHVNLHPRADAAIFGRETRRIAGPERMREQVAGISFLISPTAFFQTNIRAAEILVRLVLEAVAAGNGGDGVLDLYAGAGLFALPLARAGYRVTAVEENRDAVEDGRASARLNGIATGQCEFVAASVEHYLTRRGASPSGLPGKREAFAPRLVILDPPREGCSTAVLRGVFADIRPARAIYISCHPEALARDLAIVTAEGYKIESIQPVDMFPHTAHVETVVVLNRTRRSAGGRSGPAGGRSDPAGGRSGPDGGRSGPVGGRSGPAGGRSGPDGGRSGPVGSRSGPDGGRSGPVGGRSETYDGRSSY